MSYLDSLNDEQRRAVVIGDGPVLIIAGPGTGKTKMLTARIAHLLTNDHVPASEMVALTFTNKAAREMRERLEILLGGQLRLPTVTTFHALCLDILRDAGETKQLVTESGRQAIIQSLPKPKELKSLASRELSLQLSRAKTSLLPLTDEPMRQLLEQYNHELANRCLQDFDDLLRNTYESLNMGAMKAKYRYVLVDEFQDTSDLQYELLRLVSEMQNVFAIGDPNQSIYAFRGAGAAMFERFREDFPAVQTINLTQNYRSGPDIVRLANAIFPKPPQLIPTVVKTAMVRAAQTLNEYSEAVYVIEQIEAGIGGSDMQKARGDQLVAQPRDYAVLYRTHRTARVLQRAFAESGIPYQIAGEGSPYEEPKVQAVVAAIRQLSEPVDDVPVYDIAQSIVQHLGFEIDTPMQQFLNMTVQFANGSQGLASCLNHIDEIAEHEFYDSSVNAVTLLTIHAAKGLEFEHVFLIGVEEGILPKRHADIEEERRLLYVAVTRAKSSLELLYTKQRAGKLTKQSQFITQLPDTMLPRQDDPSLEKQEQRQKQQSLKRAQTSMFS